MLRNLIKLPNNLSRNFNTLSNGVKLVDIKNHETKVELTFQENDSTRKTLSFNPHWIRFNCHSKSSKHPDTNQRQIDSLTIPKDLKVLYTKIVENDLIVHWNDEANQEPSVLPLIYAYNNCPTNNTQATFESTFKPCKEITFFDYRKFHNKDGTRNEDEFLKYLKHMADYGLAIVQNFSQEDTYPVRDFAQMIAPIQRNIYGDVYDVKVEPDPINIAYADGPLPLHSDLVYYESPPGLQFIHCIRFDDTIKGGESLIVDSFDVAVRFKKDYPAYFDTLANTPVRFQKMHVKDGKPEVMVHHRPHIKLNHRGEIMATSWSPANEGPLKNLTEKQVADYYEAYLEYYKAVSLSPNLIEHKLEPGEILCFNNRRMLHGRKSFKNSSGARHFQGCYVNIDEFKSFLRSQLVKKEFGTTGDKNYVDLKAVNIKRITLGNNDFE